MRGEPPDVREPPFLSVVVAIVSDTVGRRCDARHLVGCLEALRAQRAPPSMEILVPHRVDMIGMEEVAASFPEVICIPVPDLTAIGAKRSSREHHDELRAAGLRAARGAVVALIEDHGRPDPEWSNGVARAHASEYAEYAAVGGAMENGIDRPLNWATYLCDFYRYQNPVQAGDSAFASDANVSYKRGALEAVREVWEHSFREPSVNEALRSRGAKIGLDPDLVVYQHRESLRTGLVLRERCAWGRSYASGRSQGLSPVGRLGRALLAPGLPPLLLLRMMTSVIRKRRAAPAFWKALPLVALLTGAWSLGESVGYAVGTPAGAPTGSGAAP